MVKFTDLDIHHLVATKQSFALYSLPNEQEAYFLQGEEFRTMHSLQGLEGEEGFIFAPFEIKDTNPLLLIKGKVKTLELNYDRQNGKAEKAHPTDSSDETQEDRRKYTQDFFKFKEALEQNQFKKLVLARSKDLSFQDNLDIKDLFANTCQHYQSAYCYLVYTPISGLWLGASPECLLTREGNNCSTVALAGTQVVGNLAKELIWSEKLKEEQSYVSKFIEEALQCLGIKIKQSKAYTISAGHLAHIKTDISFQISKAQDITQVLERLYPTPALCGLPKDEAKAFILANESLERRYYGGFFGFINAKESCKLYVNIRCMQILSAQSLRLYAGGGLLKASELEEEWQETEAKMKTMLKVL